jgi:hypothetical protein
MSAWQNRNNLSHEEKGLGHHGTPARGRLSTSSRSSPGTSPPRSPTAAVGSLFKTLAALPYFVGALATMLYVHGRWFQLPEANVEALDRTVLAGGILVLSLWPRK